MKIVGLRILDMRLPRAARRIRKPLRADWNKVLKRPILLKCAYESCHNEWAYSGQNTWVQCPSCQNYMKVAVAKRMYRRRRLLD